MNLFINDFPVRLLKVGAEVEETLFHHVIDAASAQITPDVLQNRVLIKNTSTQDLDLIFKYIDEGQAAKLEHLELATDDYKAMKAYIKSKFKIIKAAGGLVRKGNKVLMIYRLKKWDLPKGKLEGDERPKVGALREVEEECNIQVKLEKKICTTWHTYTMNRRSILKKTTWYMMESKSDLKMRPQVEEDIEEVRWMSPRDVYHALKDSYQSINYVFQRFFEKVKSLDNESMGEEA